MRPRFLGTRPLTPGLPHQSPYSLSRDPDLVRHAQLGVDAPGAVDAAGAAVDLADALGQERIVKRSLGGRTPLPGVKCLPTHAEHPAHQRDRVVGLLRGDEPVGIGHRPSLSRAKKAAAFFRISRSWRRVRFSRRRRPSSSRSSVVRPSRVPATLVATKLCAWKGRGGGDLLRSLDIHDVLTLIGVGRRGRVRSTRPAHVHPRRARRASRGGLLRLRGPKRHRFLRSSGSRTLPARPNPPRQAPRLTSLGQQMGQHAPQIPADPSGTRSAENRLK